MRRAAMLSFIFLLLAGPVLAVDSDNDGLTDEQETIYYTDPAVRDTDGDGYLDAEEVAQGFSPLAGSAMRMDQHDLDSDGLNDFLEQQFRSDMGVSDTDQDAYTDFDEVMYGYDPASTSSARFFPRKVIVDRTKQHLAFYVNNVQVVSFPVSTGNPLTPTPAGVFAVQRMLETHRYIGVGYDFPNVKWNMQFLPHYYLHGAYWHNDFGIRTRSHGCVNMRTEDAGILYKYVTIGVPVEIIGETPKKLYVEA